MANRKLVNEIDKTLKKVIEGVDLFEMVFDKISTAVNASQKEKFEGDLKKEIKKLQRYRDQIKTWLCLNEIKDKNPLTESRKLIESQMERFKAMEKELKTKAYSQAGLNASTKIDPEEEHRDLIRDWISEQTDTFSTLIDALEAEGEVLQKAKKTKRNSQTADRLAKIQFWIERHKYHQNRLELVLRMIDNGALRPEQVDEIKDDIKYYIDENQDAKFEENEYIYEDLRLEEAEVYGLGIEEEEEPEPIPKVVVSIKEKVKEEPKKKVAAEIDKSLIIPKSAVTPKKKKEEKKIIVSKPPIPPKLAPSPVEHVPPPTLRYATAAAAAISRDPTDPSPTKVSPSSSISPATELLPSIASVLMGNKKGKKILSNTTQAPILYIPKPPIITQPMVPNIEVIQTQIQPHINLHDSSLNVFEAPKLDFSIPQLEDLLATYRGLKIDKSNNISMIDESCANLPDIDTRQYYVQNAYPTPSYYPQTPLTIFQSPEIFQKFELDTLFFAFYYQKSQAQSFAARELQGRSWNFYKTYQTWFKRLGDPISVNEVEEHGDFTYFEYEGRWKQMRKEDFRLQYKNLDNDL